MKKLMMQGSGLAGVALLAACGSAGAQQDKVEDLVEAAFEKDEETLDELSTNFSDAQALRTRVGGVGEDAEYRIVHIDPDTYIARDNNMTEEGEYETYFLQFEDQHTVPLPLTFKHHDDGFLFHRLGDSASALDLSLTYEALEEENPLGLDASGETDTERLLNYQKQINEQTQALLEKMNERGYQLFDGEPPETLTSRLAVTQSFSSAGLIGENMEMNANLNDEGVQEGRVYHRDRLIYEGEMDTSVRDGFGIQYALRDDDTSLAMYMGEWKDGERHGFGLEYDYLKQSVSYAGEWENGTKSGIGAFYDVWACNEEMTDFVLGEDYESSDKPEALCSFPRRIGEVEDGQLAGLGFSTGRGNSEEYSNMLREVNGMLDIPEKVFGPTRAFQAGQFEAGEDTPESLYRQ